MAKEEIFCVGKKIPGYDHQYVPFGSNQSLLDADIIIFEPNLYNIASDFNSQQWGNVEDVLTHQFHYIKDAIQRWQKELNDAFVAGKTIFVLLRKPEGYQTNFGEIQTYGCLSINFPSLTEATGKRVKQTNEGKLLASYWKAMRDISRYEVHYDSRYLNHNRHDIFGIPLMVTSSGDRCVASWFKGDSGHIILLPALDLENSGQGKALINCLVRIHKYLQGSSTRTPQPEWCESEMYILEGEKKLHCRIAEIEKETHKLKEERDACIQDLEKQTLPRALLYETGKILESAVIDAMETFGFRADRYSDNESDFDIVFESAEGRCLGEVEGKDNKPIDIHKFQQLERHISEDFARPEIKKHAKGVLFGNPFRLTEPDNREQPFTDKVHQAAKRTGTALVHTPDMFPLVKYLKCKSDPTLSKQIRKVIVETEGEKVKFPKVPSIKKTSKN